LEKCDCRPMPPGGQKVKKKNGMLTTRKQWQTTDVQCPENYNSQKMLESDRQVLKIYAT
jgi:hypothetical protein